MGTENFPPKREPTKEKPEVRLMHPSVRHNSLPFHFRHDRDSFFFSLSTVSVFHSPPPSAPWPAVTTRGSPSAILFFPGTGRGKAEKLPASTECVARLKWISSGALIVSSPPGALSVIWCHVLFAHSDVYSPLPDLQNFSINFFPPRNFLIVRGRGLAPAQTPAVTRSLSVTWHRIGSKTSVAD